MKHGISGALAASAALLISTPAMSADMVVADVTPSLGGVAIYDWSGFHIGIGGGSGKVVHDVTVPVIPGFSFDGIGGSGYFGQLTVGYDHVFGNGVVLGAMLSGRYGNIETSLDVDPFFLLPAGLDVDLTAEYGFDAVARLGYSVTPTTLAYVLGGYTWQHFDLSSNIAGLAYNFSEGGYVLGIGTETMLRNNWTWRGEYRYSRYNTHDGGLLGLGIVNLDPSTHTFHTTLSYRLNGGPSERTVAPMVHDWSGFKVGAAVGGGALVHDVDLFNSFASFDGIGAEGFIGEINAGYDFEVGSRFVVGVVGAARLSNISTDLNIPGAAIQVEADHGFDVLLRAGMKFGDRSLGYVIGGYTYQNFEFTAPGGFSYDWDQNGYTIGSGMEMAFSDRVTAYTEYRYSEYSGEDFTGAGVPAGFLDVGSSSHTIRVGAKMKLF